MSIWPGLVQVWATPPWGPGAVRVGLFISLCHLSAHAHLGPFQAHLPFAVVGSTEEVKVGNKLVRARQYPWGVVQGECGGESTAPAGDPDSVPCPVSSP